MAKTGKEFTDATKAKSGNGESLLDFIRNFVRLETIPDLTDNHPQYGTAVADLAKDMNFSPKMIIDLWDNYRKEKNLPSSLDITQAAFWFNKYPGILHEFETRVRTGSTRDSNVTMPSHVPNSP